MSASGRLATSPVTQLAYPSGGDDTAILNASLAAIANAGGGFGQLQWARYTIAGALSIPANTGLIGATRGPFDPNSDPSANTWASTLLMTTTSSAISFAGRGSALQDVLIHYPNQVAPTAATPTVYPATISTITGSAGVMIRRLTITNGYQGLTLFGGRHFVEDLHLGCFSNPILVDHCLDVIHIDHVQCNPFWDTIAGLAYPQTIDTWVNANKVVAIVKRADNLDINDLFGFSGSIGLQMIDGTDTPAPSYGRGSNISFDTFSVGVQCKSTQSPGWNIANFSTNSSTAPISMPAGGGTSPILRVRGGSFWGAAQVPSNAANGLLDIDGVSGYNGAHASTQYSGTGVPASTLGANGDFFFRQDTPGTANQRLYVKSAGAWVAIL